METNNCPCKETWEANGFPVWDSTVTFYQGNYVVEWPAGSVTPVQESQVLMDPCKGNDVMDEATPDKEKSEEDDSVPSIGAVATILDWHLPLCEESKNRIAIPLRCVYHRK